MKFEEIKNTKKYNWLLITGGILLPFSILFMFIFHDNSFNSRLINFNKFETYVLSAILIAPFLEELVFRGIYSKSKIFKYLSIILIPFFLFFTSNTGTLNILLFSIYLALSTYILVVKKTSKLLINLSFVLNSVLFSFLHFDLSDFSTVKNLFPVISLFSIGLILIWTVINYNLFKSILFHFSWNLVLISTLFIDLQFVDSSKIEIKKDEYLITIQEVSRYPKTTSSLTYGENSIEIRSMELRQIVEIIKDKDEKKSFLSNPYKKFNINLESVNNNVSSKEINKLILKELENKKLIINTH